MKHIILRDQFSILLSNDIGPHVLLLCFVSYHTLEGVLYGAIHTIDLHVFSATIDSECFIIVFYNWSSFFLTNQKDCDSCIQDCFPLANKLSNSGQYHF